jgi:hypothetical protein
MHKQSKQEIQAKTQKGKHFSAAFPSSPSAPEK